MNTTTTTSQLEKDLRDWAPRQPSEKVSRRIFHGAQRESRFMPAWGWLAPVTACLYVTLAVLNDHNTLPPKTDTHNSMSLAESNQYYTVSSPDTFGWTKE